MFAFSKPFSSSSIVLLALSFLLLCSSSDAAGDDAFPEEMDVNAARQYVLQLINKDRTKAGMAPVAFDPAATAAAQTHADEMAEAGYLGHYDLQGRKPWERYTAAGGTGYVAENTFLQRTGMKGQIGDNVHLDDKALFHKSELERAETVFINETPPNDGHRKNILDQRHDGVGIGLAVARGDTGFRFALTQEFTNTKGTLSEIPKTIKRGQTFTVAGRLAPGIALYSVSVLWDRLPSPMKPDDISKTPSYAIPEKKLGIFWPPPYQSAIPVTLRDANGSQEFALELTAGKDWQPGIYYVEVWVRDPRVKDPYPASSRTMRLES